MAALSTIAAISAITASTVSVASTVAQARQKPPQNVLPQATPPPQLDTAEQETQKRMQLLQAKSLLPGSVTGRLSTLLAPIGKEDQAAQTQRKTLLGL